MGQPTRNPTPERSAKCFQSLTGLIPRSLLRFTKMPSEARSRLIPRSLLRGSLFFYGDMPEAVYNPVLYFKNTYTDEWITDDLPRNMIRDVDRSTVLGPRIIDSPVLGGISPRELSGGVKTLIAIYKVPEKIFNASACGDNCAKWILRIGELQDVTINLRHLMDFGEARFTAKVLNTDQIVHNMDELLPIAGMLVR